ncbi:MAG: lytic transglycosylase domain-containing protein [Cypionkella sp.]|nr:lytic transglycosylase domain-containing protein [Cypionkella sp.]
MAGKITFVLGAGIALLIGAAPVARAESLPDRQNFTFKRVAVGTPAAGKRITVQIDPAEQAALLASLPRVELRRPDEPAPTTSAPAAPSAAYPWYWDLVDPARGKMTARFNEALAALAQGPEGKMVAAPRMQAMQGLAEKYGKDILLATIGTQVSPALVLAVIGIESGGASDAISPKGAAGLMQLMPATAARFGVVDTKDIGQNIKGGVAYLDWLMGEFDRDPLMVLAAYNAGEGAVRANDGVPPYPEARDYVPKVLAAWSVASGLCASPPMLATDPCVFKVIAAG